MMSCYICHNTDGPFEIIDYKDRAILACESCAKKYIKKEKARKKREEKIKKYYYRVF